MCARCRIRNAIVGGLCILCCAGGVAAAEPPHHVRPHPVVTAVMATPADHADSPHTPERDVAEPPGHEPAAAIQAAIRLDDPTFGRLDMSPLG